MVRIRMLGGDTSAKDSEPCVQITPRKPRRRIPERLVPRSSSTLLRPTRNRGLATDGNTSGRTSRVTSQSKTATLSVIVWGRDRSSYFQGTGHGEVRVYNYSAATSGFVYDTDLKSAWDDGDPEAINRRSGN